MSDVLPTRYAYRDALVEAMAVDERLVCLDTDTGLFAGVEFGAAAGRYLNIGIAEHNLMGIAAGLAAAGRMPFVNTMATFAATRALEAVKIDIAYNNLPVRIVATHSGLSAGHLGPSHQSLEDLAVMRSLPNMTVLVPADADQTVALLRQSLDLPGPVYLRLGRKGAPALPDGLALPVAGRLQPVRPSPDPDVVVVACGPHPVRAALDAAAELDGAGVRTAVFNAHTVKPLDASALRAAVAGAALVATVEEHWPGGGLGGAVAEALADLAPRRLVRIAVPDGFVGVVGDHERLLDHYGLTAPAVATRIRRALEERALEEPEPTKQEVSLREHRVSRV